MTYVRETCGCCGESPTPHSGGAGLPWARTLVIVQVSPYLLQSPFPAMHLAVCP